MDDDVWALVKPLLPPRPERAPGPRPVDDRLRPQGILYVLHNDVAWQLLPLELGVGSGQACRRCLDRWQAGVFDEAARRENRRLREDVDILKRATAFFAQETR
ncbi:transposase [Kitasatospora sp. NPDC057904]|uniref:transposase n=1 Tax=unclassified Kitasatospora TaxID=2633591 RepID=UPI0036DF1718